MSGNKIDRFDCTNGGAQWCYGCYRMENDCDGDYVRYEDYESLITALEAENARLRAMLERASPFLHDEGDKWEDDGSNEPLELAREIDAAIDAALGEVE